MWINTPSLVRSHLPSFLFSFPKICSNKEVEPFVPKVSERPLTAISDVQLNSDIRAVKRQAFDKEKAEKEAAAQAALAILRKQQEAEEQQEIKEMRKQMVVKARPVPNYNFFEPKPSPAALTQPASPMLLTKRREVQVQSRRTSHQQQQSVHRNNRNNGRSVMRDI